MPSYVAAQAGTSGTCNKLWMRDEHRISLQVRDPEGVRGNDLDTQGLQVHGVLQLPDTPGGGQQRLGGDAAAVDACAADVMPLHYCRLHPLCLQTSPSYALSPKWRFALDRLCFQYLVQITTALQALCSLHGTFTETQVPVMLKTLQPLSKCCVAVDSPEHVSALLSYSRLVGSRRVKWALTHSTACKAAPWPPTPQPMMTRS